MSKHKVQFGYYDSPDQTVPTYEPGLEVVCPVCGAQLSLPVATVSVMMLGDNRSYFYRMHKPCGDSLTAEESYEVDSIIMDAVAASKRLN